MTPKRFNYVLIAITAIFSLVGIVAAVLFFQGVTHASDNLIIAGSSEHQIAARTDALQRLSNKLSEANSVVSTLGLVIPKQKDLPGLLASLESTAKVSGITVNSIDFSVANASPAPAAKGPTPGSTPAQTTTTPANGVATATPTPAQPKGVTTVPFKIEIEGGYGGITSFLSHLGTNTRIVDVSQISITKGKKEADDLKVVLLAKSYVQP